jgi:hypothetical protein
MMTGWATLDAVATNFCDERYGTRDVEVRAITAAT